MDGLQSLQEIKQQFPEVRGCTGKCGGNAVCRRIRRAHVDQHAASDEAARKTLPSERDFTHLGRRRLHSEDDVAGLHHHLRRAVTIPPQRKRRPISKVDAGVARGIA
jgi:hypothetical protein